MNFQSHDLAPAPSAPAAFAPRADDAFAAEPVGSAADEWLRYWVMLRRNWAAVALFVAIATGLTAIVVWRMAPWYQSTAVVRVDPTAPLNVVGDHADSAPLPANADALILTEASEAQSAAVAIPTILKLHLQSLPDLVGAVGVQPGSASAGEPLPAALVRAFQRHESVAQEQFTYLLDIGFRARSPQTAAAVANELARQLLAHEYTSRADALNAASTYMGSQLDDLRAKMERSQLRLNAFAASHGIVNPGDRFEVMNQRLSALAKDLEIDRARQRQVEADWALARIGSVDALAVSDRGAALKPLLEAEQKQQVRMAAIAAKYGPGDFLFRQAERQQVELAAAVGRERAHLLAQIQAEAVAAAARARLTSRAFAAQKASIADFSRQALQFGMLKNEADTDLRLYSDLLQRLKAAQIAAGYHADNLRIVAWAGPDPRPVAPLRVLTVLLAFVLSALGAIAFVLVASSLNRALADAADAHRWLPCEVLASLPTARYRQDLTSLLPRGTASRTPAAAPTAERSAFAESIFSLRAALCFATCHPARTLAISSAQPQEGKSSIAANLAASFALHSAKVLLIDADLRRPEIHRMFALSNQIGLSTLLHQASRWPEAVRPTALPGLHVLPAGPAVAGEPELLAVRFAPLLEELKGSFDYVIVDCPPLLGFSDALSVAAAADAALLVVRAGRTPRDFARNALEQLRHVRAHVAGVALNGVSSAISAYYDYYRDNDRRDRSDGAVAALVGKDS